MFSCGVVMQDHVDCQVLWDSCSMAIRTAETLMAVPVNALVGDITAYTALGHTVRCAPPP